MNSISGGTGDACAVSVVLEVERTVDHREVLEVGAL